MTVTPPPASIAHANQTGVYLLHAGELPKIKAQADTLGYLTTVADMQRCVNKAEALARIADALHFPDWFGHNWDALADCVTDMSWNPAPGYLIVLEHLDDLHLNAPADYATLLDVLRDAALSQAACGIPLWILTEPPVHPDRYKRPESVLVVIHTPALDVLLLERIAPIGFWQSVTGSLEPGETPYQAALREITEETGLHANRDSLRNWHQAHSFEILPEWRKRYPPDVTHNLEHVFSLCVPQRCSVTLAPAEHVRYVWAARDAAAAQVFSWTNRDAILHL